MTSPAASSATARTSARPPTLGRSLHRPGGGRLLQPRRRGRRLLPARRRRTRSSSSTCTRRPIIPAAVAEGYGQRAGRFGGNAFYARVPALLAQLVRQRGLSTTSRRASAPTTGFVPRVDTRSGPSVMVFRQILGQAQGLVQPHPSRCRRRSRLGPRSGPADRPRPDARRDVPGRPGDPGQRPRQLRPDVLRRAVLRYALRRPRLPHPALQRHPRSASRPRPAQTIDYANARGWPTRSPVGPNLALSLFRHHQPRARLHLRAPARDGRHDLHRQPEPRPSSSGTSASARFVRAIAPVPATSTQNPAMYTFPVDSRTQRPVHPVPVLLQAQSPDGPVPGLFGQRAGRRLRQLARPGPRVHDPDRPDVLPEDRLRPGRSESGPRTARQARRPTGLP
ncbi:MAG: hypothetical protein MZV63_63000 [Marinilabiliales bacterium]|nr:hypothetical protein [Marinilabiliales bacterium]